MPESLILCGFPDFLFFDFFYKFRSVAASQQIFSTDFPA